MVSKSSYFLSEYQGPEFVHSKENHQSLRYLLGLVDLEAWCHPSAAGALGAVQEIFSYLFLAFGAGNLAHLLIRVILEPLHVLNEYR